MESALDPATKIGSLSRRELQVLRLAGEGKSTDQIAYLLAINPAAALHDRAAVYDKLGLTPLTPAARLQQLVRLHDLESLDASDGHVPADAPMTPVEPSSAAFAAVAADDRLLGQGTVPESVVSEQHTVRYQPIEPLEPAPPLVGPRPVLPWGFNGGPGVMLAVLAVALVIGALLVFLFLRASQPAPVEQPAAVATALPPTPAAQNAAPPPPATPAPAPATAAAVAPAPAPAAPAPSAPPVAAAPAPAAAAAPVPAAVAPVAPPSSAPVAIAQPAPAAGTGTGSPASGGAVSAPAGSSAAAPTASGLPNLAPLAVSTPFPMPAGQTNTPANSILTLGQTWSQNGLNLTLANAQATTAGVAMNFVLSNSSGRPVTIRATRGPIFSAVDNAGTPLTLVDPNYSYDFTLQPNTAVVFDTAHAGGPVEFAGNLGGPSTTSVTVTASALSSIANARWRLALQH